jgi:hypothetical protein
MTDILGAADISSISRDDMDELELERSMHAAFRWRAEDAGWSAASKIGLASAEDAEVFVESSSPKDSLCSSSSMLSSSSCVLNLPPCIGGRKLVQRPSMQPI